MKWERAVRHRRRKRCGGRDVHSETTGGTETGGT